MCSAGLLLGSAPAALAQTCNQTVNFNYNNATPDGDRKTGSDALSTGTTVTYSGYAGTPATTDVFAVGTNAALGAGKFLVWQRDVPGGGPTSDVATVTLTFNRPVSNLTMSFNDIDKDLAAFFIDRYTFDAYDAATGGNLIDLQPSNFSGPGIANGISQFVGNGSGKTATTDPAYKKNAITGLASSTSIAVSGVTLSFPSPVQRIVITYENIAPFATATTARTHTTGFETITFCAQADVYARFTAGPTAALPGTSATYTVQFGNNGPDASAVTTRTVTIPAGATVTALGGGTLRGNILDFGTVVSNPNTSASFTYSYTLPTTPGVYNAATTATTTTGASQDGALANDADTRTTVVTPVTDLATTISGPASATQGNLITLNVTTANRGSSPSAGVVQTVQLPTNLTNVFVSNGGSYNAGTGVVTFPALTTLGAGQTVGNTISFSAPATAFAPVATVTPNTAATGDSNPANNTAYLNGATSATNVTINLVGATPKEANLYTTITASAPVVSPGAVVTLSGVTANAGPATAVNVVETVQLLPGFAAATLLINGAASTGQTGDDILFAGGTKYNTVTGLVTFAAIPSLASGASQSYAIQLTVPTNVNNELLATAFVSATTPDAAQLTTDPVLADNVAATKVSVLPTADLAAIIVGPSSVGLGQAVTYTAIFTNNGPSAVSNRMPTVQLPAGLTGVTLSEGNYNAATGLVTFPTVGSSPSGASQLYTINFTPPTTGSYTATAYTGSNTPDTVPANNSASTTTTVTPLADLTVRLSGPSSTATNGPVTYVAQTTNNGPSTAGSVTTTIQLPTGLAPANVTTSGGPGAYDPVTGKVTFTNANLASGATASNFATFSNPNLVGFSLTSTAVASSSTATDPVPGNNTSAQVTTTTVASLVNVNILTTIGGLANTASPGGSITLNIQYSGNGTAVSNVAQVLYLPPGTVVTSISGAGTYTQTTGVLTFASTSLKANNPDGYTVVLTAPATGPFTAVSTVTSLNSELPANAANNVATQIIDIIPAATTAFDEITSISGPALALPGTLVTYTVQTLNNGPASAPSATQTVTLPAGVTASNISGGGTQTGNTITFPALSNQAPGPANAARYTFAVTTPAAGSLNITAGVTAAGDSNPANNASSVTTTTANQIPVAASIVNALQAPIGNSADAQLISALSGADTDGIISSFQLTVLPNAATQGVLFYNNGGTLTAITSANFATLNLTPAQAASLRFDPVSSFVGNASFSYVTTDNTGARSNPASYTIQVGQDTNSKYTVVVKGGASPYQNGDLVASVFDVNGGKYTSTGTIDPVSDGNGVATAALPGTGPASNPTNALPAGIAFDPATGQFTVADRTLLKTGTFNLRITTLDLFGGVNTQDVALVIGANPLPVELTAFEAEAAKADAVLSWTTAVEKNSAHFVVERSLDGLSYAQVGQVAGQGTKASPTGYAFTDAGIGSQASRLVYYRLRQVDRDGTSAFSPVRTVRFGPAAAPVALGLSLYPNPATTTTTLELRGLLPGGTYQVRVLDAMGRMVRQQSCSGGQAPQLDVQTLAAGTYLVQVLGTAPDGSALRLSQRLRKD